MDLDAYAAQSRQPLNGRSAQHGDFATLGWRPFRRQLCPGGDCCIINRVLHPAPADALTNLGSRASTMRRARRDLGLGFTAGPALPASLGLLCRLLKPRPFLAMAPGCEGGCRRPPPHTDCRACYGPSYDAAE